MSLLETERRRGGEDDGDGSVLGPDTDVEGGDPCFR